MNSEILHKVKNQICELSKKPDFFNSKKDLLNELELLSNDDSKIMQLSKALHAESNNSFFNPNHYLESYQEKDIFDYEFSRFASNLLGKIYSTYDFSGLPNTVTAYSKEKVNTAVDSLDEKGYYILEDKLSDEDCEKIILALNEINFILKKSSKYVKGFNEKNLYNIKGNTC